MKRYIKNAVVPVQDEGFSERCMLAKTSTSPRLLSRLAKDPEWPVRQYVADNPNTPENALRELVNDPIRRVHSYLAKNPNLPLDLISQLYDLGSEDVMVGLARNPSTPEDYLSKLANYSGRLDEYLVRYWVAENPNTPLAVLQALLKDNKQPVAQAARRTIIKEYGSDAL